MSKNRDINRYKFEDSVQKINAITFSHLLFSIIFFAASLSQLPNPHAFICLLIFLSFFISSFFYKWTSPKINFAFLGFYILLLIFEFSFFGLPATAINYNNGYTLSKGVMMDIIVVIMPFVYFGLRLMFSLVLINLIMIRYKLQNSI